MKLFITVLKPTPSKKADKKAMEDYRELAKDTRNSYGAEAKYRLHNPSTTQKNMPLQRKELLNYI